MLGDQQGLDLLQEAIVNVIPLQMDRVSEGKRAILTDVCLDSSPVTGRDQCEASSRTFHLEHCIVDEGVFVFRNHGLWGLARRDREFGRGPKSSAQALSWKVPGKEFRGLLMSGNESVKRESVTHVSVFGSPFGLSSSFSPSWPLTLINRGGVELSS